MFHIEEILRIEALALNSSGAVRGSIVDCGSFGLLKADEASRYKGK